MALRGCYVISCHETPVVYFDQQTGAPHTVRWSKSLFCSVSDRKSCFSVRKSISISQWCAEHPFADQNTQQDARLCIYWLWLNYSKFCAEVQSLVKLGIKVGRSFVPGLNASANRRNSLKVLIFDKKVKLSFLTALSFFIFWLDSKHFGFMNYFC